MNRRRLRTLILGSGPVALIAGLAAARCGPTILSVLDWPPSAHRPRIDVIPAPFLTLLLELGVDPGQLQVAELHDARLTAWDCELPRLYRTPACAHVERATLEHALALAVARNPHIQISIASRHKPWPTADRVFDATGRKAITAECRSGPAAIWHAHTLYCEGRPSRSSRAFRLASLPDGYVYRVGSEHHVMLGIVSPNPRQSSETMEAHLRANGGGWILAGLPSLATLQVGRGGVASMQWTEGSGPITRVGDASLARDSLASQGLAVGAAEAFRLASREIPATEAPHRAVAQRMRHLESLLDTMARCRFRAAPAWSDYERSLVTSFHRDEVATL